MLNIKTITFPTYLPKVIPDKTERIWSNIKFTFIVVSLFIFTIWLGSIHISLSVIAAFGLFILYNIARAITAKKEIGLFTQNGTFTINNTGITIEQTTTIHIPFDSIIGITLKFDRADPFHFGKYPHPKTYTVKIYTNSEETTVYVDKQAELGHRRIYGDLIDTFKHIKTLDHRFYKIIHIFLPY